MSYLPIHLVHMTEAEDIEAVSELLVPSIDRHICLTLYLSVDDKELSIFKLRRKVDVLRNPIQLAVRSNKVSSDKLEKCCF